MLRQPPYDPRSARTRCLAEIRRWQFEAERLREGAAAAPLNAAQSARLLREAHAADRRACRHLEELRPN